MLSPGGARGVEKAELNGNVDSDYDHGGSSRTYVLHRVRCMMLRRTSIATFAAGIILAASALAFAQTRTTTALKTGYAPVNGLNLYYEVHGTGEPLILLHGC